MWNTLFRGFRANAQEQAIFISIGMKFPYQSFHEYLGDISFSKNTNLVKMELRKRLEKNVFIRELNDLAAMELYLIWWEEMTFNKEGVSKPHTTIVVQDFAIALNLKKHINYTKCMYASYGHRGCLILTRTNSTRFSFKNIVKTQKAL